MSIAASRRLRAAMALYAAALASAGLALGLRHVLPWPMGMAVAGMMLTLADDVAPSALLQSEDDAQAEPLLYRSHPPFTHRMATYAALAEATERRYEMPPLMMNSHPDYDTVLASLIPRVLCDDGLAARLRAEPARRLRALAKYLEQTGTTPETDADHLGQLDRGPLPEELSTAVARAM